MDSMKLHTIALLVASAPEGRILEVNPGFEEISGYPASETVGKRIVDLALWIGSDVPFREAAAARSRLLNFRTKAGVLCRGLCSEEIDTTGEEPLWIVCLTDLCGATLNLTDQKLQTEEIRLHQALDAAKGGAWEWNLMTNENIWSDELWKVYGLEPHSVQPSYEAWLNTIHPDDRAAAVGAVMKAAQESTELRTEWRVVDADGSLRWLMSRGQPVFSADGKPERFIGTVLDVTELKQAELDLRESEERYRTVADYTYDWEYWRAPDGTIRYMSPSCERVTGYSVEEFIQNPGLLDQIVFLEDRNRYKAHHSQAKAETTGQQIFDIDFRIVRRDGQIRWIAHSCRAIRREDGTLLGRRATNRDISERRQAESAVSQSRATLLAALHSMTDAVFISDDAGQFIDFNDAFATYHRFTNREECSKTFADYPDILNVYFSDGTLAPVEQWAVPRALRGEVVVNAEYILERKDSGERWNGSYNFAPIRDPQGNIVGSVVVARDITEPKRIEAEIRTLNTQLEQRVRERTVELADLYNNAPCGYHSLNRDGVFTRVNDTELAWLGYQREELVGKVKVPDILTPESRKTFAETFPLFLQTGQLKDLELEFIRKDGSILPALVSATAIYDQDGHYLASRSTLIDYSALKQAEQSVQQTNKRLETALKELEAFSYSVSHDLRSPLRGIDGWSLALLEDCHDQLGQQGQEYIDRIRAEARRMSQLIDDLLRLSRVTRAEMKQGPVNLSDLAQTIVTRLAAAEPERSVEVNIQPGLMVQGDASFLEVMLTNFLDNAWKFTRKRDQARIEFGKTEQAGQMVFTVRDNGAGFDMKYSQKLFGAFQRLHKPSEFPGTGIGLATAQRIIHRHGGRVWIESQPEQGTTVFFTIQEP